MSAIIVLSFGWAAFVFVHPASSAIPQGYTVTDLGTLAGDWSGANTRPWSINDFGGVVGQSLTSNAGLRGFTWTPVGGMEELSEPQECQASYAMDISNTGQIVGWVTYGETVTLSRACIWDGGQRLELPTLGGPHSYAFGVSASGVVGYSYPSEQPGWHAFRYTGGVMEDLGTLGGSHSVAYDISESGRIVGYAQTSDNVNHAVIWGDETIDLGAGIARAINDQDRVAGRLHVAGVSRAFIYDGGETHLLDVPGVFEASEALDINDQAMVVGLAWNSELQNACVWDSFGVAANLNDLVPSDFEWILKQATGINNAGQIVAFGEKPGWEDHAFLLTPVPEPATVALLALGGLVTFRRRRR